MKPPAIDRSLPPEPRPLGMVPFPFVERTQLENGIPVFLIKHGEEEILELQFSFPAGKSFELSPGMASLTGKMMSEGAGGLSGSELASAFEYWGAFHSISAGYESSTVGISLLTKHLPHVAPLLRKLICEPHFPESEWAKMQKRSLQNLAVEEEKTAYVARREFTQHLWGAPHPYGRSTGREDILNLKVEDFRSFHAQHFALANACIIAVGQYDEKALLAELNAQFGDPSQIEGQSAIGPEMSAARQAPLEAATGLHYFEKGDTMQASLRVGHRGIARDHEDYTPMQVVTTLFGGYFGSRLMKNIREDKGYTYGIHAGWLSMKYGGMMVIQTDVGNEYIEPTLREIEHELNLLMDKGTTEEELAVVKNYLLGRSISGRETPSQLASIIASYIAMGLDFGDLDKKFDLIQSVTPERVKELCAKHYHPDQLLKVVCGKMG